MQGSNVIIRSLDSNFLQTGESVTTQTNDNFGSFEIAETISGDYVEIEAAGYYFNEVKGKISDGPITLRTIVPLNEEEVNVNLLTTLATERIKHLVKEESMNYSEAKAQAEKEILKSFDIPPEIIDQISNFEKMDISQSGTGNAILLAISSTILGNQDPGTLTQTMSEIISDIKKDGNLNEEFKNKFNKHSANLDLDKIRNNLDKRYKDIGASVQIPNFEDYIDSKGNGIINLYDYNLLEPEGKENTTTPTFTWSNSEIPGRTFRLEIAEDENFETIIKTEKNIEDNNYKINDDILNYNTEYFWRLILIDNNGEKYHFRVAVIDENGKKAQWNPISFEINLGKFEKGSGTKEDPYIIERAEQLDNIRNFTDKHFRLANNIDLEGYNWVPIPSGEKGFYDRFWGSFDGNGYKILNLSINGKNEDVYDTGRGIGIFSRLARGSTIKNLIVENVEIIASDNSIGTVVGTNKGNIKNVSVIGDDTSKLTGKEKIGGVVGGITESGNLDESEVENLSIEGYQKIGSLTGTNSGTISNSSSVNSKILGRKRLGGLAGDNYDSIVNSYFVGENSLSDSPLEFTGGNWSQTNSYDNYFDKDVAGTPTVNKEGIIGLTTTEMQQKSSFSNWDFVEIWTIDEENTYPYLQWNN